MLFSFLDAYSIFQFILGETIVLMPILFISYVRVRVCVAFLGNYYICICNNSQWNDSCCKITKASRVTFRILEDQANICVRWKRCNLSLLFIIVPHKSTGKAPVKTASRSQSGVVKIFIYFQRRYRSHSSSFSSLQWDLNPSSVLMRCLIEQGSIEAPLSSSLSRDIFHPNEIVTFHQCNAVFFSDPLIFIVPALYVYLDREECSTSVWTRQSARWNGESKV